MSTSFLLTGSCETDLLPQVASSQSILTEFHRPADPILGKSSSSRFTPQPTATPFHIDCLSYVYFLGVAEAFEKDIGQKKINLGVGECSV